jgi:hypothetical protein
MAHTISDRTRIARDIELNGADRARQTKLVREGLEFAGQVVEIWNGRLAGGLELFFTPTIRAAIASRHPILSFYCPACEITGEIDLRKVDRHRSTPITSLVPSLSCQRCGPNAPFARLTGLRPDRPEQVPRNLDLEASMIVSNAREAAMRRRRDDE